MKTILITGSTDGIGKLAAVLLAKQGHEILVHGRKKEKLERTLDEIQEGSGNTNLRGFTADLSDFSSIQKMIREINQSVPKIDVLINNAGVFKSAPATNADGLDIRFVVNFLAPYLLTNGLLSLLESSLSPRVIHLSSAAQAPVSIDALKGLEPLSDQDAYAQSKLALTMWSFAFAKAHPNIVSLAVNPGSLLNTKMVNEAYGHHWSPAQKGADILYELALSAEFANHSGCYFDNDTGALNRVHRDAYDTEKTAQLLAETKNILSSK